MKRERYGYLGRRFYNIFIIRSTEKNKSGCGNSARGSFRWEDPISDPDLGGSDSKAGGAPVYSDGIREGRSGSRAATRIDMEVTFRIRGVWNWRQDAVSCRV